MDEIRLPQLSENCQNKIRERFDKTIKDLEEKGFSINKKNYPYVIKHFLFI